METEDLKQTETRARTRRRSSYQMEASNEEDIICAMDQRRGSNRTKMLTTKVMTSTLLLVVAKLALLNRVVDGAMSLPDGIENILGFVPRSTFQCERDGYFGDIDNDCKIFHLCQKQVHANGRTEWRHWTYACGNQTMFNQLTLTCAFVDEAIPCKHASQFQYLNEVIHKPREPFLTDADVTSGISYYSNRIMSDGARARAFEDSRLMAQLGGSNLLQEQPEATQNTHHQYQNQHFNTASENTNLRRDAEITIPENSLNQAIQSEQNTFLQNIQTDNNQQHFAPLSHPKIRSIAAQPSQISQFAHAQVALQSQTQVQLNQQHQHPQRVAPSAPNSFEFAITTNHQQVPAAPASVFISNLALPQLAPSQSQVATERSLPAPTTLAPTKAQEATTTARQIVATAAATTQSTPTTSVATQAPTTSATTRAAPVAATTTTTQRAQVLAQHPRRRQASRPAHHHQQQQQQQLQARQQQHQRQQIFDHQLNGMFQSTRLGSSSTAATASRSANNRQQSQKPALVMRRHISEAAPAVTSTASVGPQAGGEFEVVQDNDDKICDRNTK